MYSTLALLAADSTPMPTYTGDPNQVTPGFVGFALMALIVVAVFVIIWDMQRRIRRTRYREEANDALDLAEQQALAASFASTADDQATDASADPSFADATELDDEAPKA